MEGLEASIIPRNALENLDTLGSEYYSRRYVADQEAVRNGPFPVKQLRDICSLITDGDHGVADYQSSGIPFILSENVKEGWVDVSSLRKISANHHTTLKRSQIKEMDVLVTKTGMYFGKSAVAGADLGEANTIAHVGILRRKNNEIDPYFLSTFMNSRYGQSQLRRRGIKATRPEIKLVEFHDIEVPLVSQDLASAVRALVLQSQTIRKGIERSREAARNILLSALELDDWRPPEPLAYTSPASTVSAAGRWDAQFHAPAVSALRANLAAKFDLLRLAEAGVVTSGRSVPYDVEGLIPILRSGDVGKDREIGELLHADVSEPIFYVKKGDVLISSIGFGSIGRVEAVYRDVPVGTVSEVTVVRQEIFDAHFLVAYLQSFVGQMQLERHITGATGQLHLYPRDVGEVFVPILDEQAQTHQRQWADRARVERVKAAKLLKVAKRAVEIAIEDGEAAALAYLGQAEESH